MKLASAVQPNRMGEDILCEDIGSARPVIRRLRAVIRQYCVDAIAIYLTAIHKHIGAIPRDRRAAKCFRRKWIRRSAAAMRMIRWRGVRWCNIGSRKKRRESLVAKEEELHHNRRLIR